MKYRDLTLKLAVSLGLATVSSTLGLSNPQIPTLAVDLAPTVLLSEIPTKTITLKSSSQSLTHQQEKLESISVQTSSVSIFLIGGGVIVIIAIAASWRPRAILGLVRIRQDEVGIVIKTVGHPIPTNQIIARKGEAGVQADTLSPGWHWRYWSWMYTIRQEPIINISSDEIGLVEAKDGDSLPRGQTFGQVVECDNFQDAQAFLKNGGQRGKQQAIVTTGSYRINTELFNLSKESLTRIETGEIGLIEAKDGASLKPGQTFGRTVICDNFQDTQKFFENGGQRGKQRAILNEGTYYINTNIFKVSKGKLTHIESGEIGLVEARDGSPMPQGQQFGQAVECDNFQDAETFLRKVGQKGKQRVILTPGIYQINTDLFEISKIPIVEIPLGQIGLVEAKDGAILSSERIFGKAVDCNNFQDAQVFLENGGQQGKQLSILKAGKYQINTDIFSIKIAPVTQIDSNEIGLVEAKDGVSPQPGQTFGKVVGCDNFQDAQAFLENGGQKGQQRAIIPEGTYYINTELFKIRKEKLTRINQGEIGLVEAQDGAPLETGQSFGRVIECTNFQDAQAFLENGGQKGKQLSILRTGNYQINTDLFHIHKEEAIRIGHDEIGLVEALGGAIITQGQTFGKVVDCNNFQNAQAFLENGGQKGKQLAFLTTGTYYINTYLFSIRKELITKIASDEIGLIEAENGAALQPGKTFGKVVDCSQFQDAQQFLENGGQKGKQLAFLTTGNYQINTDFFSVSKIPTVTILSNQIGLVEAKDGESLPSERIFGKMVDCNNFQDAQAFLENGGQRGKQLAVLKEGTYQINTDLFSIDVVPVTKIDKDEIGLVEAKDGAALKPGQSFSKIVDCDNFQDTEAFLEKGGQKGKQRAILTTGTYYINTALFSIRKEKAIHISSEQIGLVEAKDGASPEQGNKLGKIVECDNFQDVQQFFENGGQRGKQIAMLTAGTYQINTDLFSTDIVPITKINSDEIGLVEAKYGTPLEQGKMFGKIVECESFQDAQKFFDNGGQRGKQLLVLPEGTYYINTELFSIRKEKIVQIGADEIGLVIANDGEPFESGQTLGKIVECNQFQDAQAFLDNGGQKGKQLAILAAGKYRINTDLFTVITTSNATENDMKPEDLQVITIGNDKIGVVTTNDGKALEKGEIAGSVIPGHENFQKPQTFIDNGGQQGLQEEFLPSGRWVLNPWFVNVEQFPLTVIPNGHVGVIISNIGKNPEGNEQLVERGYKGIWKTPYRTGTHAINTGVQKVVIIPTNDLVLRWSSQKEQKPEKDIPKIYRNLPALEVQDNKGFKFAVEVTQVIRVHEEDAPKFVSKVASTDNNSIDELIEEVLKDTVRNYFLNAAREYKEALEFWKERDELQGRAKEHVKEALKAYNVEAVDTLILNIYLPPEIEKLLQDQAVAQHTMQKYEIDAQVAKKEQDKILEEERAKFAVSQAQEELNAKIAAMQRDERRKEKEAELDLQKQAYEVEIQQLGQRADVEANAKERMAEVDINSERERTNIEVARQQALSQLNTAETNLIQTLGPDRYAQIKTFEASQQAEIAKAIAMIQAAMASQSTDVEKTKAIAAALGTLKMLPNVQSIMGGDALNAIANSVGYQLNPLLSMLGQSNPNLLNLFGVGQFGLVQQNPNPQLSNAEQTRLSPNQFIASLSPQASSNQVVEPRCPVLLLLDTSSSMSGEPINYLNAGIAAFKQEVEQDPNVSQCLDLAITTFNSNGRTVQEFVPINQFVPPQLSAEGQTVMGKGIELALNELESRKTSYETGNISYRKPWLFLIIGSEPTDNWQHSVQLVREAVEAQKLNFFVVAVQGADLISLRQIAHPRTPPVMLDGLKFRELFHWLAEALKSNSISEVGGKVKFPPRSSWERVDDTYQK